MRLALPGVHAADACALYKAGVRANVLFLAAAALVAGCATVLPPAAPATPAPAAWSGPAPAATAPWQGFGDALLTQLVDEAMAANTDLAAARAALAQARAQRDLVAAGQSVQVGSSASVGRNRSAGRSDTRLQAGLDASWEIDAFGALGQANAAAERSAEASAASLEATRLSIAGETAIAYAQWRLAREQLGIARQSAQSQADTLQIVQWRVAAGLATPLDADQARASLESTRAQVPALEKTLAQGANALAVLTGRAPGALAERLAGAPEALPLPGLPTLALPADTLRQRPDVHAAELRALSAWSTLAQRDAERRPSFSISGSLAWQAATWSALGGPASLVAGIAAGVNWPLLDGGAASARVALQQGVLDEAEAGYRAAVLGALQDVEDNLAALAADRERVATLERALAAAESALALADARYRAGLTDFTTLLDSQRSALSARNALAAARTDLWLSHVRLAKALGGAWPGTT